MTQILILASCFYLSLLAAAIYFTGANARHVIGAFLGDVRPIKRIVSRCDWSGATTVILPPA
jgi:hypothetical protein